MPKRLLLFLCLGLVLACEKAELYHELTEDDANEILVVLTQNGIESKKVKEIRQNQISWTIEVEPEKLPEARQLLVEHNLPRKREPAMKDIYSKDVLIPTPDQQKAKFLVSLKGDIINALRSIPDVVSADVVLNVPSPEEFTSSQEATRPTASVVVKVRPTEQAMANITEPKVQRFVANAVEKMDPRDVTVIVTYTAPPPQGVMPGQTLVLPSQVAQGKPEPRQSSAPTASGHVSVAGVEVSLQSSARLKLYLGLFLGLIALLSAGLVATILQAMRLRRSATGREALPAIPGQVAGEAPRLGPGGGDGG
ncbi:MAG: hypothetical protein HY543_01980 [Deltaproteobacteria bacterium]|nr:hypothetical protein [Deltaproteobacteria bacterium]